jgi:hypothetical protein
MAGKQPATEIARRARQIAGAQNAFRDRMRDAGYRRLQAWVPSEVFETLHKICERDNLTQGEALAKSIDLHYKMLQVEN